MVSMTVEHELPVSGRDAVAALRASGALDEVLAQIDAGALQIDGKNGLIQELIKVVLERGLQVELADHVGYDKGDPDAALFPNSRNGHRPRR